MKKLVLFIFSVLLIGSAEPVIAQSSVNDAQKFAKRCLKKVRNRRFRKLQESYPQAMKDIERIKANASEKEFGWDDIVKYAPDWIEMMETFDKFPEGQVKNKGKVIKFDITDYKPLLEKATDSATEEHYRAGVKIMDENERYSERKEAFYHFNKSRDYSDKYKEDIYQRSATIHYDEGLRIYNSAESFGGKKRAEEPFKKALAWIDPFKDINELMAEIYYAEAIRHFETLKSDDEIAELLFKNEGIWDEVEDITNESLDYLKETAEWIPEYKDSGEKAKEFREKAASFLYKTGKKHEEVHEFEHQEKAAEYYRKTSEWVSGYRNAEALATAAEQRSRFDVLFYHQGSFINPSKVGFGSSNRIKAPYDKQWGLLSVNPVDNPEYAVSEVGRPFIAVVESEKGEYNYEKSEKREQEEYTVYISRKKEDDGSFTESETDKATYDLYNMAKDKVKDVMWVKKYSGTATYVYPEAKANVTNTISIWDLRDPANPVLLDQVSSTFEVSDKTSYMEYDGHPRAKPEFKNKYGDLKSKDALISEIHGKAYEIENVYKNASDEIRKSILQNVKYIHF
ncbi:MAG: hypothetical protein ACQESX_08140 [Bacteroidota bacterium]